MSRTFAIPVISYPTIPKANPIPKIPPANTTHAKAAVVHREAVEAEDDGASSPASVPPPATAALTSNTAASGSPSSVACPGIATAAAAAAGASVVRASAIGSDVVGIACGVVDWVMGGYVGIGVSRYVGRYVGSNVGSGVSRYVGRYVGSRYDVGRYVGVGVSTSVGIGVVGVGLAKFGAVVDDAGGMLGFANAPPRTVAAATASGMTDFMVCCSFRLVPPIAMEVG